MVRHIGDTFATVNTFDECYFRATCINDCDSATACKRTGALFSQAKIVRETVNLGALFGRRQLPSDVIGTAMASSSDKYVGRVSIDREKCNLSTEEFRSIHSNK